MAKIAPAVTLSDSDRIQLQQWVRAQFTPQQVALRSRILLLAAAGKENLEIAAELKVNRHTPALWRQRFIEEGLDAVWEIHSGRGRKPHYPAGKVAAIVEATLQTKPVTGHFKTSHSGSNQNRPPEVFNSYQDS